MECVISITQRPFLPQRFAPETPEYTETGTTLEAGERHEELLEGLLAELAAQRADVDVELVTRAFRFAAAAHEGQQRRSGEPFITHPVGVATVCAGLRLDEQTIAAALLHDVVEDTRGEPAPLPRDVRD